MQRLGLMKLINTYTFNVLLGCTKKNLKLLIAQGRNHISPEYHRLTLTQVGFHYMGPMTWNKVPINSRAKSISESFRIHLSIKIDFDGFIEVYSENFLIN